MNKPEGQEQGQTEFHIDKNPVLRVSKKGAHRSVEIVADKQRSESGHFTSNLLIQTIIQSFSFSQILSQHTQDSDSVREC